MRHRIDPDREADDDGEVVFHQLFHPAARPRNPVKARLARPDYRHGARFRSSLDKLTKSIGASSR
jgi:hypothetical protein